MTNQQVPAAETQEQTIVTPEPAGGAAGGDAGRLAGDRAGDASQQTGDRVGRAHSAAHDQRPDEHPPAGNADDEHPPAGNADDEHLPAGNADDEHPPATPGFGERGRMRRRARFLRKARELAYRDLGGLVYDLHRFGQRNDPVVLAKLGTLGQIDTELRALEQALHEIKPVTVLREVGIAACPRCAAIHGHEDRFCPGCGLAFDAGAERPLSTAPVAAAPVNTPTGGEAGSTGGAAKQPSTLSPAGLPASAAPSPSSPAVASPPVKPTAAPVAAKPSTVDKGEGKRDTRAGDSRAGDERGDPEDEPTQILRPPTGRA